MSIIPLIMLIFYIILVDRAIRGDEYKKEIAERTKELKEWNQKS